MKEKHKCSRRKGGQSIMGALLRHSFPDEMECDKNATYFENDRWWCGFHAPSKIKEREDRNEAKYFARIRKNLNKAP